MSPEGHAKVAAGIYVHVPFCSAVCPYCDFAVQVGARAVRERYVKCLLAEIERTPADGLVFDTIYFGGGTPSLLEGVELGAILDALTARYSFAPEPCVFLEVNPEDVTPAAAAAWRALGVHTVSLGVQSLDPQELRFLGRRHTPAEARAAVSAVVAPGFPTVSVDWIYGLPGQDLASWERSLEEMAATLAPAHVSCYQLTVAAGTPFERRRARGTLVELPDEEQRAFFVATHRKLVSLGFEPYEVSNFARAPGHRSRHNMKYWCHAPYLGLGPAAHSFRDARRWWNVRRFADYEKRIEAGESPIDGGEDLDAEALALEAVMLGLRTTRGVDVAAFARRFGFDLVAANEAVVARGIEEREMEPVTGQLRLTLEGLAIADAIAARFDVTAARGGAR